MLKTLFVLIALNTSAEQPTIKIDEFLTLEQCNKVATTLYDMTKPKSQKYICYEKQVKLKKMHCNINTKFIHWYNNSWSGDWDFPYAKSFSCVEE